MSRKHRNAYDNSVAVLARETSRGINTPLKCWLSLRGSLSESESQKLFDDAVIPICCPKCLGEGWRVVFDKELGRAARLNCEVCGGDGLKPEMRAPGAIFLELGVTDDR
jgi:hypothetical protein